MIVIPMAGLSSRFFKAGYDVPKYQLDLNGQTVFSWAVSSFEKYFKTDSFVFIYRDVFNTRNFIELEIKELGIVNYQLVCLENETLGQADTVYQGLQKINTNSDDEIFIFNIDSKLLNFTKPKWIDDCDAYLEVFKGEGSHWSFIEKGDGNLVIRTTEKDRISNLCSNGLYYFKSSQSFKGLVEFALANQYMVNNELYIAPLYNLMIQKHQIVRYQEVEFDEILFCGTPDEYIALKDAI